MDSPVMDSRRSHQDPSPPLWIRSFSQDYHRITLNGHPLAELSRMAFVAHKPAGHAEKWDLTWNFRVLGDLERKVSFMVTRCCPQNISVRLWLSDGFGHRLCSHRGWSFEAANISRAVVSRPQTELYSFPAWYLQSKCWKKAFGNCLFLHVHDMLEDCFLLLLIALKKLVPPDPVYDHFPLISDYNFCVYPIFNIFRQPHYCYIFPFLLIESYQIHHIAHISLSIPIMIAFALSPHN